MHNTLPETGFLRVWQIIGDRKKNIPPLIPIGRSTFFKNIKDQKYPYLKPIKLAKRTTAYRVEDVKRLITELGGAV